MLYFLISLLSIRHSLCKIPYPSSLSSLSYFLDTFTLGTLSLKNDLLVQVRVSPKHIRS